MSGESCRVCEHPYRKLIEIDIYGLSGYGGLDNRNVEMKYGIGDLRLLREDDLRFLAQFN